MKRIQTFKNISSFKHAISRRKKRGKRYHDKEVLQLGRQIKQNTTPSEKYSFMFRVNSYGAVKNTRNYSMNCEINLLHEIQEKSPPMHTASPKTSIGRQYTLQTHNITLPGKYSPIQKTVHA
jgi:hypothetical protein